MHTDALPLARATLHYLATLTGQGYSPETVRLYRQTRTQFAAFLGGEPTLGDFTLERALRYWQHLQQRLCQATPLGRRSTGGLNPNTIHQHGRVLRSFSSWLRRHDYLEANRLADFHPGRLPERVVEPLRPAERQRVLAAMGTDSYCRRARARRGPDASRLGGAGLRAVRAHPRRRGPGERRGAGAARQGRQGPPPGGRDADPGGVARLRISLPALTGPHRRCRRSVSRCS